jgi:hypothetical protein
MFKRFALTLLLLSSFLAHAQTIFNCTGFAASSSGSICSVSNNAGAATFAQFGENTSFSGTQADFVPTGSAHNGYGLVYQTAVSDTAFTTTFTFVPNTWNLAFVINNATTNPGYDGPEFRSGAGCEAGFYQGFGTRPNNVFAIKFGNDDFMTAGASGYTYSTVQLYQQNQDPCNPNDASSDYWTTNKISTSPVPLGTVNNQYTTTGDTYSTTITYDGSNVVLSLYDVTAGGSCPGASCFTHTWSNISIPSFVDGTTGYVGFTSGVGSGPAEPSSSPLYINTFSYTVNSPTATPSFAAWNANSTTNNGTLSAATPVYSVAPGTYSSAQTVSLSSSSSGANICYVLATSTPSLLPLPDNQGNCAVGTAYSGAITISSTETLYATAGLTYNGPPSAVVAGTYSIGGSSAPQAATPTFSPAAATYTSSQSVTISDATSGATIYYTTNGSTPTTSSTVYTGPITVSSSETVQAIAAASGYTNSAVGSAAYAIEHAASAPTFAPASGSYTVPQTVTISDATSDAAIYYTTNGATPTTSSTEYTGPITVSSTETLEAIAVATGDTNSAVASATYTITPTVSTPTFSPAAGAYTSAQSVSISDATSGATIYYTTNGTTPTTSSTAYTGPITVSSTETLEAIAVATGDSNTAVASAAYTISSSLPSVSTPTFSPAAGTYNSAQSVSISDVTSGATIYYTTNGTTPTTSSTAYTGPIPVSSTETLQAIAVASSDSAVASAAYTITVKPNFLLGTSAASLTVNSGDQGTVMVTVTPENGFDSPVILACSGLPTWATCSFDQTTVTPSGGAATTQLTISTSTQSSALRSGSRAFFPFTALAMTVGLFGWRKRRGWHHWLLLAIGYAGLGLLFGCGGTSGAGGTSTTALATSTVTVTAISGTLQGTAAITLTVN